MLNANKQPSQSPASVKLGTRKDDYHTQADTADRTALQIASQHDTSSASQIQSKCPITKRRKALLAASVVIVIIGLAGAGWWYFGRTKKPAAVESSNVVAKSPESPKLVESSLTGVEVEPDKASAPIMASIIENLAGAARPQSGLSTAGVVYEALSEGGITRYLAIWQLDTPSDIGPVRSLRPVFYNAAMEYGAPTAHAGGSTDAMALARSGNGFRDLDEFINGGWFRRISTRFAPHNLYISGAKLRELVKSKQWDSATTFAGWPRKADSASDAPNASLVKVNFSGSDYAALFRYDKTTNSYLREIAGTPDLDLAAENKQISPKTVIVIMAATSPGIQPNGKPKTNIETIGTGKGYIFQDGTVTQIVWAKKSASDRMAFTGPDGQTVKLNRGQAWISIVPTTLPPSWQ